MIRVRIILDLDALDGASERNVRAFVAGLLPFEHPWAPRIADVLFPWNASRNVGPVADEDLPPTHRQGEPK